ncbi:8362_t:CDS:2, partial [Funneliformis geosporum]
WTDSLIGFLVVLKYFKTYDEETCTYEHFLNELKETIITSPPYTDDWSSLHAFITNVQGRFWVVVIFYGIVRSRGFAEVFGAQVMSKECFWNENDKRRQMKSFFQDIVLEREKVSILTLSFTRKVKKFFLTIFLNLLKLRNAGKNYVIEGVRVLNEARFMSLNRKRAIANSRRQDDIKWKQQLLIIMKLPLEITLLGKRRMKYHLSTWIIFKETYQEMDSNQMWTLKSGRKVEEVIYAFARNLFRESYLHSFIINDVDVEAKSLFANEEWKEITTSEVKDKRSLEQSHMNLLKEYTVDNVEKLQEIIFEPFLQDGSKYDNRSHFDLNYYISLFIQSNVILVAEG